MFIIDVIITVRVSAFHKSDHEVKNKKKSIFKYEIKFSTDLLLFESIIHRPLINVRRAIIQFSFKRLSDVPSLLMSIPIKCGCCLHIYCIMLTSFESARFGYPIAHLGDLDNCIWKLIVLNQCGHIQFYVLVMLRVMIKMFLFGNVTECAERILNSQA